MPNQFLILTPVQAEAVSGPTAAQAVLSPMPLADGVRFVLPLAVLDDPAHEARHAELALLPVAEVSVADFPAAALPAPMS